MDTESQDYFSQPRNHDEDSQIPTSPPVVSEPIELNVPVLTMTHSEKTVVTESIVASPSKSARIESILNETSTSIEQQVSIYLYNSC
jgi:hypothetical protein